MSREIQTKNPATEEILSSYALFESSQIRAALTLARLTFLDWQKSSMQERSALLQKIATKLLANKQALAQLIHLEMGKNINEALSEIEKCADCAIYYSKNGPEFLKDVEIKTEAQKSYVHFEPLGTVFAIMPWNFPFWQAFRCALPAILAGNSVLLKHASNVTGCALAIEEIFTECFGKKGIFQSLVISGETALQLIAEKEISAVSFTGSTPVGKKIAGFAGSHLKKSVLELGGSDAYLILEDADLPMAAEICAKSRLINAGQSCIAAKRFIVQESILKEFESLFLKEMQKNKIAPMARGDLREELHAQVVKSEKQGARIVCGGLIPSQKGFYYPPTILTNVDSNNIAFKEELFGPVAAIIAAKNKDEAVKMANLTNFGLGAAVFTKSIAAGEKIAREELIAGSCFVNALVKSDPRLPFGGTKESGFGRELSSFGLQEFVNIKTVYIN